MSEQCESPNVGSSWYPSRNDGSEFTVSMAYSMPALVPISSAHGEILPSFVRLNGKTTPSLMGTFAGGVSWASCPVQQTNIAPMHHHTNPYNCIFLPCIRDCTHNSASTRNQYNINQLVFRIWRPVYNVMRSNNQTQDDGAYIIPLSITLNI